jgi:hypothetical protein
MMKNVVIFILFFCFIVNASISIIEIQEDIKEVVRQNYKQLNNQPKVFIHDIHKIEEKRNIVKVETRVIVMFAGNSFLQLKLNVVFKKNDVNILNIDDLYTLKRMKIKPIRFFLKGK